MHSPVQTQLENAVRILEAPGVEAAPHFTRPTFLMCSPEWYGVDYVINPWMAGNLHRPNRDLAFAQWKQLYAAVRLVADVKLLQARPASPDMTFVAHAAVVDHGVAAISSFAYAERQAEETHLRRWLAQNGFLIWDTPRETPFEGEGDVLADPYRRLLWAAHGARTCRYSHRHVGDAWHARVQSLQLVDPRFYHLDTCFAPLSGGHLLYFPGAFDQSSLARLEAQVPQAMRIIVTEREATNFLCNALNIGEHVLLPAWAGSAAAGSAANRLRNAGYTVTELPLTEFVRGGGAAKSLVLRLSDMAVTHAEREG